MNKLRGEVEIELAGEKWTMRPTFEALSNIEGKLNKSIPEITKAHREGSVRVTDVATIIWEGLVAANEGKPPLAREKSDRRLRYEEVGNMIIKDGFAKVLKQDALILFLLYGLAGELALNEAKQQEENKTTDENPTKRAE